MVFEVDMRKKEGIELGASGLKGLLQEIRMLLATRKGSLPLDRDYGLSWDFIDLPMPEAMPYMISEIATQLNKYVPKIKIQDIAFKSSDPVEGILQPMVTFQIRDEYLSEFV